MFRVTIVCTSLFLASLCAGVSVAQENPLAHFTGSVDVIVRLREPDQSFEKLIKVVNKIQPGVGDALAGQKGAVLGKLISNPTLTAVDESRDWYLGVYSVKDAPPTIVFAIPATNTSEFIAALGDGFKTQVHKNWVLYTEADAIPTASESDSALKLLSPATQTRLKTGDLTTFVNSRHLSEVYADQLELVKDQALEALNNLRHVTPPQGEFDLEAIANMYSGIAESFFQMVKDADATTFSLNLSETEIGLDHFVDFKAGSDSANFLAKSKQSKFEQLSYMPRNWPCYVGASGNLNELMEWGILSSTAMLKLEGEQKAAADSLKDELKKVQFGATFSAIDIVDSATACLRGASLTEAKPAALLRDINQKSQKTFGTISTDAFEQTTTLQVDAETYGSHKGDIVTIKQIHKEDPTGMQQKFVDIILGPDGMEGRYCYFDDFMLSTAGGGKKLMEDFVNSVETKKSNRMEKYRGNLMEEGNLLVLFDLPGLVGRGVKVASKVEGSPLMVNSSAIDNLGLKTSYIGIAVGSEGNTLKGQLRVPMDQITDMTKLSVLIGASMNPGL